MVRSMSGGPLVGLEVQVSEVLDYKYVDHWEQNNLVELVRHTKQRDYVLTADDAEAGAGCTYGESA